MHVRVPAPAQPHQPPGTRRTHTVARWALICASLGSALALQGCNAASLFGFGDAKSEGLTLATWNMDWLMTPTAHDELAARCVRQQPASNERALPCTPGRTPPPTRTQADFDALARSAEQLRKAQHADVVALQEVDGAAAARQVFQKGWKLDCFVQRAHPQKVGFAIREGLPYRCNGDLLALDVDGSTRAGADITLYPGTPQEVRLLAVHLKSGCFDGRMDRHFAPCERLRQQAPVIEDWIDQRVREGTALAVLGDFNRHLDKDARFDAGPDEAAPLNLMQAWSDNKPSGAVLLRATEGAPAVPCDADDTHKAYIDDILIDQKLAARNKNRRFARLPYDPADRGKQLSDHCPLIWSLQP
jgi:endonuclease/exonuclease/phosphatase family metal-dependent hydrolase